MIADKGLGGLPTQVTERKRDNRAIRAMALLSDARDAEMVGGCVRLGWRCLKSDGVRAGVDSSTGGDMELSSTVYRGIEASKPEDTRRSE